jgi:hypothetical protein
MPLLPGFEGEVGSPSGTALHAITHWNYASICRYMQKEHLFLEYGRSRLLLNFPVSSQNTISYYFERMSWQRAEQNLRLCYSFIIRIHESWLLGKLTSSIFNCGEPEVHLNNV